MWVSSSILDAAIIKDAGKLGGSPKRVPDPRLVGPGHWLPPAADLATARRTFVRGCKIYDSKEKAGTHLDDHPIGVP